MRNPNFVSAMLRDVPTFDKNGIAVKLRGGPFDGLILYVPTDKIMQSIKGNDPRLSMPLDVDTESTAQYGIRFRPGPISELLELDAWFTGYGELIEDCGDDENL